MKWFVYIALIIGCIYLADKANDYMQPLSLIEVVQEKKTPYEGWQLWNNQSQKADRYIYYTLHGNGWEIIKALWPVLSPIALIILFLAPFSFSLFRQLRDRERKQLKKELIDTRSYSKQRISESDERATKAVMLKLKKKFLDAQQAEKAAIIREQEAAAIEAGFKAEIKRIKIEAEQQVELAETKAALAEALATEAERKKKNAAATAERRKRKLAKAKKLSIS